MDKSTRISVTLIIISFIVLTGSCEKKQLPVLETSEISNITGTTATSGGTITDEGSGTIISRGVCWSTSTSPTTADNKTSDGAGAGTFTSNITGLNTATNYYVRAYATNSAGTSYGDEVSFPTIDGKCTIIMDRNFKIFNIAYVYYAAPVNNLDIEYIYYDNRVERINTYNYPGNVTRTMREEYYLNNNGLADSICYYDYDGITSKLYRKLYCTYNADRNLIAQSDNFGQSINYTWINGNLIRITSNDPTSSPKTYTYTSLENMIDFTPFAGKKSRQLIQTILQESMVDPPCAAKTIFAYKLNPNNLVELQMASTCDRLETVTKFEYIISN